MEKIFFDKKMILLLGAMLLLLVIMMSLGARDTLDARLYYSANQARALFASYTPAERQTYFRTEILDLFFALTYTAIFILTFGKIFPRNLFFLYLAVLPGLCDWIETSVILYTLRQSEPLYAFDWLGLFTCAKWGIGAPVALILIILSFRKFGMNRRVQV